MEYGTLDLTVIAQQINREKYLSRRIRVIFFAIMAILTVLYWVVVLPNSLDPCACILPDAIRMFVIIFLPILAYGIFILFYRNWRHRHAIPKQYIARLEALDLSSIPKGSSFRVMSIILTWVVLNFCLFLIYPPLVPLSILLILFPLFVPGLWLNAPFHKGDYEKTLQRARLIRRWYIGNTEALPIEALAYSFADRAEESEQAYRLLLARLVRNKLYVGLGLNNYACELLNQQRFEEALLLLETAILCQPGFVNTYYSLASWYLEQNLAPERALELAEFGLKLPGSSLTTPLRGAILAWAEARSGLADRARVTLQEALKKANPKHIPYFAELNRIAGETYLTLNDLPAARQHFARAAELDTKGRIGRIAREKLESLPSD